MKKRILCLLLGLLCAWLLSRYLSKPVNELDEAADIVHLLIIRVLAVQLVLGGDARAKSLVVKATGEELLDVTEDIPAFAVVQDRPFNNEIKLAYPNARTTYPANRLRRLRRSSFRPPRRPWRCCRRPSADCTTS